MALNILPKKVLLENHDMGSTFATDPMPCNGQDNIGIQAKWIGSPVGVFGVQVSNNYYPGDSVFPYNAGTWSDLEFGKTISSSGSADDAIFNLNNLPFSFWRFTYTYTSGSGLLTVVVTQKGV